MLLNGRKDEDDEDAKKDALDGVSDEGDEAKKMKARNAYVRLRYKGGGTMDITEESSGCTIVDCASGEADTISVSLFNKSGKWFKKNYFPKSSDYIRATIVVDKWKNDSEHREVYQGKLCSRSICSIRISGYG